jgi:hypothetical protein
MQEAEPVEFSVAMTALILFVSIDRGCSRVLTALDGRNHDQCS